MTRPLQQTAITAAAFAMLALAGCEDKDDSGMSASPLPAAPPMAAMAPEPAVMPAPAPVPATMTVISVDLGKAIGADHRVSASLASFARTDTMHASVVTDGASAGKLSAKWMFKNGRVIDTQERSVPAGSQVTDFSISKPEGWPLGTYTLQLSTDGTVVQTRAFEIR